MNTQPYIRIYELDYGWGSVYQIINFSDDFPLPYNRIKYDVLTIDELNALHDIPNVDVFLDDMTSRKWG